MLYRMDMSNSSLIKHIDYRFERPVQEKYNMLYGSQRRTTIWQTGQRWMLAALGCLLVLSVAATATAHSEESASVTATAHGDDSNQHISAEGTWHFGFVGLGVLG